MALQRIRKVAEEFNTYDKVLRNRGIGGGKIKMFWNLLCYGARPVDYVRFEFWRKSRYEKKRYLTWVKYSRLYKELRRTVSNNICGGDKFVEYDFFKDFITRDWMKITSSTTSEELKSFIEKYGTVIVKPRNGEQGHGVYKLKADDETGFAKLLEGAKTVDFLAEEVDKNCDELAAINESSLNTVRVTTIADSKGNVQIFSIVLRVGMPGSHVDNWGAGGVGYNFDIKIGICNQYGKDKKNNPYTFHPGSNVQMIGFKLPKFNELLEYMHKITALCPDARYVGWDIAMTPKGFDLIEMNCPAGHDMFQSFDNPVLDFMKKSWN